MKLIGNGIYLRFFEESDAESMVMLNQRNREFFKPYLIDRHEDFFTVDYQTAAIRAGIRMMEQDQKYSLGIFLNEGHELIGVVSLTEIVRGALQSCWIGYYMDRAQNSNGYTTEAVRLVVKYAFQHLGLHRVEAGVIPHNAASIRVLDKAGFHHEGLNKKNVLINGQWRDHLHFSGLPLMLIPMLSCFTFEWELKRLGRRHRDRLLGGCFPMTVLTPTCGPACGRPFTDTQAD